MGSPIRWTRAGDAPAYACPHASLRDLPSTPRSALLRGATSARAMGVEVSSMWWPLWGPKGGSSVPASRPRPIAAESSGQENLRNPHPTLCSALPQTIPRPAMGVLPPHRRPGTERQWGLAGAGARGCAAAAPGSLITSARSAPARSSQLPSNTRELNSSINRREALHFGERWRG